MIDTAGVPCILIESMTLLVENSSAFSVVLGAPLFMSLSCREAWSNWTFRLLISLSTSKKN